MDVSRRTIQNLTAALDEKREELSTFYHQFGGKLLGDSHDPAILSGAVSTERIETWQELFNARAAATQAILDIRAAISRQQELYSFRKELEKTLIEVNGQYKENLESLGRVFFSQYTDSDADFFGETYEKASRERNNLILLEEKQEKLQQQLIESGFFGKMFAQFKMAGLASNIRQQKARILHILSDGASLLVSSGYLERRMAEGTIDTNLAEIINEVKDTLVRLDDMKTRSKTLEEDLAGITETLKSLSAADNPLRRLDELQNIIKETDKRIDSLIILSAREYSDKFLDENGSSLLGNTGDGHTFSDMGAYSHQLEQIALLRSDITIIRRKIEILETTYKIESIDKNIASHEHAIEGYEQKIRHYQESVVSLRKIIEEISEEKKRLGEHKDAIEKTLL